MVSIYIYLYLYIYLSIYIYIYIYISIYIYIYICVQVFCSCVCLWFQAPRPLTAHGHKDLLQTIGTLPGAYTFLDLGKTTDGLHNSSVDCRLATDMLFGPRPTFAFALLFEGIIASHQLYQSVGLRRDVSGSTCGTLACPMGLLKRMGRPAHEDHCRIGVLKWLSDTNAILARAFR